jgi:hypothetical protein
MTFTAHPATDVNPSCLNRGSWRIVKKWGLLHQLSWQRHRRAPPIQEDGGVASFVVSA